MEALIVQFMAYFFPVEDVPEPILAVFGFLLCFLALYMLLGMFVAIFTRFCHG